MKRDENMAREYVKKDNMLSKEIRYKKTEKGMMITEYYGNDSYVVLPDEIEGEPVTILGDYAFSRNQRSILCSLCCPC